MTATIGISSITIDGRPDVLGDLIIECESIDVSTAASTTAPDPRWELVDAAGHWHAWDDEGKLPTLEQRTRHDTYDDEDDEGYDYSYYACRICGQKIEPGRVVTHGAGERRTMPGRMSWRVVVPVELPRGKAVSVRATTPRGVYFGVGIADDSMCTQAGWRSAVYGNGPLGHRKEGKS